jgi:hypothetical protein
MANAFVGHLEKTFKPNELPQNEELETEINKALKEPLQITQPINFLTPKEILITQYKKSQPKESPWI